MSIEIECLRRWLNEIADRVVELEDKVQDLETKTASDLSQTVVAESATSEEQDCLWVARDKRTNTLYVYEVEPIEQYCETFAADDEEEKAFRIDFDLFPEVTFENSPQKLVLDNSEKPNNEDFDRERALELLDRIEQKDAGIEDLNEELKELRQLLGGSDEA